MPWGDAILSGRRSGNFGWLQIYYADSLIFNWDAPRNGCLRGHHPRRFPILNETDHRRRSTRDVGSEDGLFNESFLIFRILSISATTTNGEWGAFGKSHNILQTANFFCWPRFSGHRSRRWDDVFTPNKEILNYLVVSYTFLRFEQYYPVPERLPSSSQLWALLIGDIASLTGFSRDSHCIQIRVLKRH